MKIAKLIFALALLSVGLFGLHRIKIALLEAKEIPIADAFVGIQLPSGATSIAYTVKGKDRYCWGKILLPNDKESEFYAINQLDPQNLGDAGNESQMRNLRLLVRFRPKESNSWLRDTFVATKKATRNGVEFLIGRDNTNPDAAIVYLLGP